ncbi:MAG: HAD hydrolase-like protein [Akkermansiaceae bacterium]
MHYRAIIFDFDGTLADTLEHTRSIYNQLASEYGLRRVESHEMEQLRDFSLSELLKHLDISKFRVPSLLSRGTAMLRERIAEIPIIPGIADVIPELRRRSETFGVLTSNTTDNVNLFLNTHGLREHFTFVSSTSKLTGKAKHIKAIRKTFSLRAEEMLYIGDEIRDVKASHKAGIAVAAVTWGFNSRNALHAHDPHHLIDAPGQLLQIHRKA